MSSLITKDRLDVIDRFVRDTASLESRFMAELGVYMGGSARVILESSAEDRRFLCLYDTFEGLPIDGGNHRKGEFAASPYQVRDTLGTWSIDRISGVTRVLMFPGVFPESVMESESMDFSFVHADADLYESTRDAIEFFWPRMVSGGVMIFDDVHWNDCPGVDQALNESGLMLNVEILAPHQGVVRKP
jgi:hypothetical protein